MPVHDSQSATVPGEHRAEVAQPPYSHEVKQLLARIREVLAHMVVQRHALASELGVQQLRHQWRTAAAGTGRAWALRPGLAPAPVDRR